VDKITTLKNHITEISSHHDFIHHEWFVEYHLEVIEQLVTELLVKYPQAESEVIYCMVWLHDLGKIITNKQLDRREEDEITFSEGRRLLEEFGFNQNIINKVISNLKIFEKVTKISPNEINIETQIVLSADGASHFIGPFFHLYWKENSDDRVLDLINSGLRKMDKDWNSKIILPEVRNLIKDRVEMLREFDLGYRRKKRFFS
jgi:hypothetical protein